MAIEVMVTEHRLWIARACSAVTLSRAAYYASTVDWARRDAEVVDVLNGIVAKRTRWRFWKCFWRMRTDGCGWNHKRVKRVYCQMRLNLRRLAQRRTFTRERQPKEAPQGLNRIWSMDFMHDAMNDGRTFRMLNVVDGDNRKTARVEYGKSFLSARGVQLIKQCVAVYGKLDVIRADHGPAFSADKFTGWVELNSINLLHTDPNESKRFGFIDRFIRSFRGKACDPHLFIRRGGVQ